MRIARIFFDSDLRCGFEGLTEHARKENSPLKNLNGYAIFINRARTAFKLIAREYLVYYRNGRRIIPLTALQFLPERFGAGELNIDKAMSRAILKDLKVKLNIRGDEDETTDSDTRIRRTGNNTIPGITT